MSDIHRLLDEAFTGVAMTPDLQDLKEELRGNLAARVDELQSRGTDAATAASTAVSELDIPELIAGLESAPTVTSPGAAAAAAMRLHRVRPKPGFVVRASIASVVVLVCALHVVTDSASNPVAGQLWAVGFGLVIAFLVADSLRQETAQRYAMPTVRALRWGIASGLLAAGVGYGGVAVWHLTSTGPLAAAVILALAGIMGLIALGVTQTNRMKPWALAQAHQYMADDRFSRDPAAAARFGMYTVIIWIAALTVFVVLSITIGFAWSWLALVGGLLVFFLVLSRMLFAPEKGSPGTK